MATYSATPGKLNLTVRAGDDFSALIDFDPIALTGHTFTSTIASVVTGQAVGAFVTTLADGEAGKVNISMSDSGTAAIPGGTYRWTMASTSGSVQRTYLEGYVEVTR